MHNHLVAGVFVLAGCVTVGAQRGPAGPGGVNGVRIGGSTPAVAALPAGPGKANAKDPYARLFPASLARAAAQPARSHDLPPRKTVCGLTVWNVTPDLDRRSVLRPGTAGNTYTMRRLAPPVCAD